MRYVCFGDVLKTGQNLVMMRYEFSFTYIASSIYVLRGSQLCCEVPSCCSYRVCEDDRNYGPRPLVMSSMDARRLATSLHQPAVYKDDPFMAQTVSQGHWECVTKSEIRKISMVTR